ncbi:MAG: hypothetical protein Q9219_005380 [cf. Caloplaca sp. 3 TL-2023]
MCAISQSTKSSKTGDGEYIGEKGIGFKSVFKAADVVWISSRDFTFKFDRKKPLGVVAPIWADFLGATQLGWTSIHLQLSESFDEAALIHELSTFDSNVVIFLRRIRAINIRITSQDKQVWNKTCHKIESWQDADLVTTLETDHSTSQYLIRTHIIHALPKEDKRRGWHQTKILLAFPIVDFREQPRLIYQNVYAFLPIRNYGLKFLVQADFLLTASREDIESTLPWNRTIRNALAEAFLSSVDHFNQDASAESDNNRQKLFQILGVRVWEASEICRVIIEIHGSPSFDPKILTVDQLITHAAFLYQASWQPPKTADLWFATIRNERCLGRTLYIPSSIEANSSASRVFSQLQKHFGVIHNDYHKAFTSDADWPTWLVNNLGLSKVPRLITPNVDPRAQPTETLEARDSMRVIENHPDKLLKKIETIKVLAPSITQTSNHALQDYQMQLMLLEQQNKKRLLMAQSDQDSTVHIHQSLMRSSAKQQPCFQQKGTQQSAPQATSVEETSDVEKLVPKFQPYQKDDSKGQGQAETANGASWRGISKSSGETEKTFAISEEFTIMFRECHSSDVLQLLKDHWHYYSQWIDGTHMQWQDASFLQSSNQLRHALGACWVASAKGSFKLRETVLPSIDPQLDEALIPVVNIENAQHPEWILLNHFGVVTKGDIHYYLRCLIAISKTYYPDVDQVTYIYENIESRYQGNEELIRYASPRNWTQSRSTNTPSAAFYERDIILIYSKSHLSAQPAKWTNMKECRSKNIPIESEYPSTSYLFRCLRSPSGDPVTQTVTAATLITSSAKLNDISRLLGKVSQALKNVNTSKAAQLLRPLQDQPIFPVTNGLGRDEYDHLLTAIDRSWLIADRPLLRDSFHGKVPLLALPIDDLAALEDMFRGLRLDDRMLSKLGTSRMHSRGRTATHWAYTASLRAKSPFIEA